MNPNIKDDIGESKNIASKHPNILKHLDGLIEQHIKDTNAFIPKLNPNFDPAQFKPERIGQPALRWRVPKPKPQSKPSQ